MASVLALALALALVAAACGGGDRGEDATSGGAGPSTTDAADAGAGDGPEMFGDLASPCGPGDASGATDQGVTDSSITIGYGDDAGFPSSPGLNAEMSAAVEAMMDWCNQQGGINGREVVGNYYDAKITEVKNVMTEACGQVFMLVGQGWALDSAQEETRRACGLPAVPTYSVSPAFANGPLMYQAVPNPVDINRAQVAPAFADMHPDKIAKTAVMYANYAATIDTKDKVLQSWPEFGFEFLECPQEYSITGEADWKPFAQNLKDCGAEIVYFTGSPTPHFQNFLEAAAQIGFEPLYIVDVNFYDDTFAQWNQDGYGDNVYVHGTYVPMFEANASPATQKYLDILAEAGGEISLLGQQATSSFLLWATAAKECGSELTRACVVDRLSQVTEWTGGGMHASGNPAENVPPPCGMVIRLQGTEFVRAYPEEVAEFDCDPSYNVSVAGRVVEQANLDADRTAQLG